ncbi:hypothetical protein PT273_05250 [Orbaceae bacterium ESL0727]|nr:hypothetical protein [Orbaceae bacterium ESL0727]
MKTYSRLVYLCLCGMVIMSTGCDKKSPEPKSEQQSATEQTTTSSESTTPTAPTSALTVGVINSYLFHTEPELLPNHKLIKQQSVTGQGEKEITYNAQGYVASYNLQDLHAEVNYETGKYLYQVKDNKTIYDITFDNIKNILGMKNSEGDIVARSEFDEQGHLIETVLSHFIGNNIIFRSQIIYDQDRVDQVLYTAYVPVDDETKFPVFSQEKNVIYNANQQLAQTVVKTFKLASNGDIIINQQNEQEVESTETCTYSDYNENDDWTTAQCITTGEEAKTVNLVRTIQYQ